MVARLILLLALLLPVAAADHVYSHRVILTGRVVDAEGLPVAGQPVSVAFTGLDAEGRCFDSRDEKTGPQGDFVLCRHAHVVPEGVRASVTVANATAESDVTPELRRAAVQIRLPGGTPGRDIEGERLFAQTFRVEGRVMRVAPAGTRVEGVEVAATPVAGERVAILLERPGEALAFANATTDEKGDYAIDLAVGEIPEGARVRMATPEGEARGEASPVFRRADLDLVLADENAGSDDAQPGTSTPRVPLASWLVPAALGAAAVIAAGARRR